MASEEWRLLGCGMLHHVALVRIDPSSGCVGC
jgi:hypothetical protein